MIRYSLKIDLVISQCSSQIDQSLAIKSSSSSPMIQRSVDIESFSGVKAPLTMETDVLRWRFRFQDIRTGMLVVLPVVLVVKHTSTDNTSGTYSLSLVNSLKVGLIHTLHPRSSKNHFTNWAFQALVYFD